jgi:hypothetical protein
LHRGAPAIGVDRREAGAAQLLGLGDDFVDLVRSPGSSIGVWKRSFATAARFAGSTEPPGADAG